MRRKVDDLLTELKQALRQIYGENLSGIYLYGSYATGEEDLESDLDVAIVLKELGDYWVEIQRTSHVISELSLEYGVPISPVRVQESDWLREESPFLNNVRKECIPL